MEIESVLHPYSKTWNMKPVVAINDPCHESWEKMNPEQQGRMCDQCCKIVVDFTKMSNKTIAKYLEQRTEQKVCGRFRVEQVAALPKARIRFSFNIQRFAAAVFIAFGSFLFASCSSMKPHEPEIMGDIAYIPDTTIRHQQPDTTAKQLIGKPEVAGKQPGTICVEPEDTNFIMGDVAYYPEE